MSFNVPQVIWVILVLVLLLLIGVLPLWLGVSPLWRWLIMALGMLLFLVIVGFKVNGRWDGILIDSTKKISLSRLQVTLWTGLFFSAYFVLAFTRLLPCLSNTDQQLSCVPTNPLLIPIPQELIWALGISVTSFTGSTLIQNTKKTKQVASNQLERLYDAQKTNAAFSSADIHREGVLQANNETTQASWLDIVKGNDIGDFWTVNISKVQMLLFTLVVIMTYGFAMGALLGGDIAILLESSGVEFPSFSNELNTLLGISHAGYLSVKTVDQL